jgi:hypothetical protein
MGLSLFVEYSAQRPALDGTGGARLFNRNGLCKNGLGKKPIEPRFDFPKRTQRARARLSLPGLVADPTGRARATLWRSDPGAGARPDGPIRRLGAGRRWQGVVARNEADGNLGRRRALTGAEAPSRPPPRATAGGSLGPDVIAPTVGNDDEGGDGWRRCRVEPALARLGRLSNRGDAGRDSLRPTRRARRRAGGPGPSRPGRGRSVDEEPAEPDVALTAGERVQSWKPDSGASAAPRGRLRRAGNRAL